MCNNRQFSKLRSFAAFVVNSHFASAASFASIILSCIRYPAVPVCKNVQRQNQPLKMHLIFIQWGENKPVSPGEWHPDITSLYHTSNVHQL